MYCEILKYNNFNIISNTTWDKIATLLFQANVKISTVISHKLLQNIAKNEKFMYVGPNERK